MPTKNMIGVRMRARSGSTDTCRTVKSIEQKALQPKRLRKIRKIKKKVPLRNMIEFYSLTPEEEEVRKRKEVHELVRERLFDLGVFPPGVTSVDGVDVYTRYSDKDTFFLSVSYTSPTNNGWVELPLVKATIKKNQDLDTYELNSDPEFMGDKDSTDKTINALHNKGIWDHDVIAKALLKKKTKKVEGQGNDFTSKYPGTRILGLFINRG